MSNYSEEANRESLQRAELSSTRNSELRLKTIEKLMEKTLEVLKDINKHLSNSIKL